MIRNTFCGFLLYALASCPARASLENEVFSTVNGGSQLTTDSQQPAYPAPKVTDELYTTIVTQKYTSQSGNNSLHIFCQTLQHCASPSPTPLSPHVYLGTPPSYEYYPFEHYPLVYGDLLEKENTDKKYTKEENRLVFLLDRLKSHGKLQKYINEENALGDTPLSILTSSKKWTYPANVISILLEYGANPDIAFEKAVKSGSNYSLTLLLKSKQVNVNKLCDKMHPVSTLIKLLLQADTKDAVNCCFAKIINLLAQEKTNRWLICQTLPATLDKGWIPELNLSSASLKQCNTSLEIEQYKAGMVKKLSAYLGNYLNLLCSGYVRMHPYANKKGFDAFNALMPLVTAFMQPTYTSFPVFDILDSRVEAIKKRQKELETESPKDTTEDSDDDIYD